MSVFEDIDLDIENNSIELSSHINKRAESNKFSRGTSRNWSILETTCERDSLNTSPN